MTEIEFIMLADGLADGLAHGPDHDGSPATSSAAAVHSRREIFVERDAHFLQFSVAIARYAEGSARESWIGSGHPGLDLFRI
jgi:hypothetical protein